MDENLEVGNMGEGEGALLGGTLRPESHGGADGTA